ncbi:CACTA en-spm transposon protein [Cucumis melo var. makuwa]|uniref:CACTA en-spm transposon protein n=1 Tax=Cucumis melo var. makuwa TaxID=1194695 RepID=A0A5A7TMZ2_CUCMM|nr:CACTA en-spm transposon protein [Cucumis melo var. makuwa]
MDHPIDHVELFKKTHTRDGQFVLQAAADAHSQPTLKGSQPLSRDEICEIDFGRQPSYSKGLGWGPKPKSRNFVGSSSSMSVKRELAYSKEVNELKTRLEVIEEESNRKHEESARLIEA